MNIQTTAVTCASVIMNLLLVNYRNFAVGTLMRNNF